MSTTAALAAATGLPSSCPVAPLARDAAAVLKAMDDEDNADPGTDPSAVAAAKNRHLALFDRASGIEHFASHLAATSATGALFHLSMISSHLDRVDDCVPEDSPKAEKADSSIVAITRMLYSVQGFIEAATGESADGACGGYYLPRRLNPHPTVNAALSGRPKSEPSADPVFAAIDRAKAAYAAMMAVEPEQAEWEEVNTAEHAAWADLLACAPTTVSGVAALAEYIVNSPDEARRDDARDMLSVIRLIGASLRNAEASIGALRNLAEQFPEA